MAVSITTETRDRDGSVAEAITSVSTSTYTSVIPLVVHTVSIFSTENAFR